MTQKKSIQAIPNDSHKDLALFRRKIRSFYAKNKRIMPWRETHDPYRIWISEIMLQQTQVDRVRQKYAEFISCFPTVQVLANAPMAVILKLWQGLGYNRRALHLKKAAEIIVEQYNATIPSSITALISLPGIGPATAGAIRTYAWNLPNIFIETNIRSVFIHHFFPTKKNITDAQLVPYIQSALDTKNPREWCYALMDYGSYLKRTQLNPSRASKHYTRQSKFQGSNRQLRGKILAMYVEHIKQSKFSNRFTLAIVKKALAPYGYDVAVLKNIFDVMRREGFFTD